jgi:DNA topoisomerase I
VNDANRADIESAREAGLRYVASYRGGFRRVRAGKGFNYLTPEGRALRDEPTLRRIRSLVIPPAWTDVWICADANGHIQATGRDDRRRKQYRYHRRWRVVRDENKFNRMIAFGQTLPRIRQRVRRELRAPGLGREKVLAALVRLLDLSTIRVGNDEYANHNKSYGLTTLKNRHAKVNGSKIHLHFRGKSGKEHAITIDHPRLSRIVKRCQDLPGQELFQYVEEDGTVRNITSSDVNDYLLELSGKDFTSKDFRTWAGTVLAARALCACEPAGSRAEAKRTVVHAIESVAQRLGNTPAVCRKCYIHPAILDSYFDGTLTECFHIARPNGLSAPGQHTPTEETAVLKLLKRRLKASGEEQIPKLLKKSLQKITRKN